MPRYTTSIRSALPAPEALAYVADLRNLEYWDPGVRSVAQRVGDGVGPDASYDVRLATAPMTLTYETVEHEPDSITLEARNLVLRSVDVVSVVPDGAGSIVTYDATLSLNGPLGLVDSLMKPAFTRIGDAAAAGLRKALDGAFV